jgi:hypothetical protein
MKDVVLGALWECEPCPDSPEEGRACRSCEAHAVANAVTWHLIRVDEELLSDPLMAPIYQQLVAQQERARLPWWKRWLP